MKIVINACYGGFGLSKQAIEYIWDKHHKVIDQYVGYDNPADRSDPALVDAVETLGEKADGRFAELKVVEIPDDVQWQIDEYDGNEWVAEKHRIWD